MQLPHVIQDAFDRNIEFLTDEHCEWKLEIEGNNDYIKDTVGEEVLVIGNNGFGDYLFLKVKAGSQKPAIPLFKFWHEGPEVDEVKVELECYLGLRPYAPSKTSVPKYSDGSTVSLRDDVEFKSFFRKKRGKVTYITGISPLNHKIETVGIAGMEVELPCGTTYMVSATESGHHFKKTVQKLLGEQDATSNGG
jgi:hypothetical protein